VGDPNAAALKDDFDFESANEKFERGSLERPEAPAKPVMTDGFFDMLSCEALEKCGLVEATPRHDRRMQHATNVETFGSSRTHTYNNYGRGGSSGGGRWSGRGSGPPGSMPAGRSGARDGSGGRSHSQRAGGDSSGRGGEGTRAPSRAWGGRAGRGRGRENVPVQAAR